VACLLASAGCGSCLQLAVAPAGLRSPRALSMPASSAGLVRCRTSPPRASLVDAASVLVADDVFGEVFMAGMSIAFASVGATVFVGILVNGKYDDIEQSFFEAQDEEVTRDGDRAASSSSQAAKDFFGDVNPTSTPSPPSTLPSREPADLA